MAWGLPLHLQQSHLNRCLNRPVWHFCKFHKVWVALSQTQTPLHLVPTQFKPQTWLINHRYYYYSETTKIKFQRLSEISRRRIWKWPHKIVVVAFLDQTFRKEIIVCKIRQKKKLFWMLETWSPQFFQNNKLRFSSRRFVF